MNAPDEAFTEFAANVARRLNAGAEEYQDRSFSADPDQLVREIEEELWDVCGWAFILQRRVRMLKLAIARLKDAAE